jgi:DNA-binding response OmpR family regulator
MWLASVPLLAVGGFVAGAYLAGDLHHVILVALGAVVARASNKYGRVKRPSERTGTYADKRMTPAEQPILVIETDGDLGHAIVDQLTADEHPAKLALSATHATAPADREPPALVVLGKLDFPHDALTLLRTTRADSPDTPWHQYVPVILLSPTTQKPDLLRAFEAGADGTLDSHASRLRRNLSADGERWIINIRSVGYRLI